MKTARQYSNDIISSLEDNRLKAINFKKKNTANLEEMKKFTRLEDAITRAMDNIRRATMEDIVRR